MRHFFKTLIMTGLFWPFIVLHAFSDFIVEDIRVDGLERVDIGLVYNAIPLDLPERLDDDTTTEVIRSLFETGEFSDVELFRLDNTLVIQLVERPTIGRLTINGNNDIKDDDLLKALESIEIIEGYPYDPSVLSSVQYELEQQYLALGKYSATVDVVESEMSRNRVALTIEISEGLPAKIKQIQIIGNEVFTEKELLKQVSLTTSGFWTWLSGSDKYSREKLQGDLEAIRSYYLDRGYLKFDFTSVQVQITPNKKDIYITLAVNEGEQFFISDVQLEGEYLIPEILVRTFLSVKSGDLFSRANVNYSSSAIAAILGERGYAYANVDTEYDINEEDKTVALTFISDPGSRIYVRNIGFSGNVVTQDEVLRREMIQVEDTWLSTAKLRMSQTKLNQLGFFENVNVDTSRVPGTVDQVDIDVDVTEASSGNITAGLGYSQLDGFLLDLGLTERNFFGSGNQVDLTFRQSESFQVYSLGYYNPFYTVDGVSRGYNLIYQKTDLSKVNVTNYSTDIIGGSVVYGIPINPTDRLSLRIQARNTKMKVNESSASTQVIDFVEEYGTDFNELSLIGSWSRNRLDRFTFPTDGYRILLSGEVSAPIDDLKYYKITLDSSWYTPLWGDFVLNVRGDAGYGNGYGNFGQLPLFKNFYAGGLTQFGTVRGYRGNTLGPVDSLGDPLGGNILLTGTLETVFPIPFVESNSVRASTFFDFGNVYNSYYQSDIDFTLRTSVGVGLQWISPLGPFAFSLAKALNPGETDVTEFFQFNIGVSY